MEKLDFLGGKLTFYTDKKSTSQTKFGGFISVLVIIILGLLIFAFGQDFFKRTNPSVVQSTVFDQKYPEYIVNNGNFSIAFALEDDGGNVINRPDLFNIRFSYFSYDIGSDNKWEETAFINLDVVECTREMIEDETNFFDRKELIYCPKLKNITLGGYWDTNFIRGMEIDVTQCKEGELNFFNEPCGSNSERQKYLTDKMYFALYFPQVIVNPNSYDRGLQKVIKTNYYMIDPLVQKNPYFFFQESILKTDYGWLLKDEVADNLLGFKHNYMDIVSQNLLQGGEFSTSLTICSIYMDREINEFRREYNKIQTLAAQVGGVMKLFLTLGSLLINEYNLLTTKLSLGKYLKFNNEKNDILNKLDFTVKDNNLFSKNNNKDASEPAKYDNIKINNLVSNYTKEAEYINNNDDSNAKINSIKDQKAEVQVSKS